MRKASLALPRIWHSYLMLWICGFLASVWLFAAICASLLVLFLDTRLHRPARAAIALTCFTLAFIFAAWQIDHLENDIPGLPQWAVHKPGAPETAIRGTIDNVLWLPDRRVRILLTDVRPQADPQAKPLPGLCAWTWQNPPADIYPSAGRTVSVKAKIREAHGLVNREEQTDYMLSRGIYWRFYTEGDRGEPSITGKPDFLASLRHSLRDNFILALTPDADPEHLSQAKAILLALIFGDRSYLNNNTVNDFANATIAHSLALSGQHLCLAVLLGLLLVKICAGIRPTIYLKKPGPYLAALASVPFAVIYLWVGNAPPSLIRAACMLFIFTFWLWRGNVFSGIDLLCTALALILIFWPMGIFDIGIQLSILCVAVIVTTAPAINSILGSVNSLTASLPARILDVLKKICAVSLVIQLFLLPLLLSRFGTIGLWFPVNALWLPLLGSIVLPFAAIGLILACIPLNICLGAAALCLNIAALPCSALLKFLEWLRLHDLLREPAVMLPHWSAFISYAALLPLFAWLYGNRNASENIFRAKKLAAMVLILLAFAPITRILVNFSSGPGISTLDVGQGQAILVSFAPESKIVIDGGDAFTPRSDMGKNVVVPAISTNSRPVLAAIFNSHPDMDHLGGLFYTADKLGPEYFFYNGENLKPRKGHLQQKPVSVSGKTILYAGDKIILGDPAAGLQLEVLHPPADMSEDEARPAARFQGNAASLVLRLTRHGQGLALFMGDASKKIQSLLLDQDLDLGAPLIIAPHHGSDRNFLPEFYEAVNPELVIASCGYQNRWYFPGKKLKEYLKKADIPLLTTATLGRIDVTFDRDGRLNIRSMRDVKTK